VSVPRPGLGTNHHKECQTSNDPHCSVKGAQETKSGNQNTADEKVVKPAEGSRNRGREGEPANQAGELLAKYTARIKLLETTIISKDSIILSLGERLKNRNSSVSEKAVKGEGMAETEKGLNQGPQEQILNVLQAKQGKVKNQEFYDTLKKYNDEVIKREKVMLLEDKRKREVITSLGSLLGPRTAELYSLSCEDVKEMVQERLNMNKMAEEKLSLLESRLQEETMKNIGLEEQMERLKRKGSPGSPWHGEGVLDSPSSVRSSRMVSYIESPERLANKTGETDGQGKATIMSFSLESQAGERRGWPERDSLNTRRTSEERSCR
jgi:hypothetical protein